MFFLKNRNEVLQLLPHIESGIGNPTWQLTLCYAFSWLAVFFSIIKGVASSGKVAYFTAIYPYVVLIVLLITGAMKDGATDGMWYFIRPQWSKL
jgi:solute carrier family 6 amino acid transporter-like protein 5/7/9/14